MENIENHMQQQMEIHDASSQISRNLETLKLSEVFLARVININFNHKDKESEKYISSINLIIELL